MNLTDRQKSEKSHNADGVKTMGQLDREHRQVMDAQPTVARCSWCPWTFDGSAAEAREASAYHRSSEHPDKVNGRSPRQLLDAMDVAEGSEAANGNGASGGPRCKVTGCTAPPKATRGRYALLCETHIETVKAANQPSRAPIGEQAATQPDPGGRMTAWSKEEIIAAIQKWAREHGRPPTANEWTKRIIGYPSASTVAKHFGSWAEGIEAAGFPRPVRGGQTSSGQQPPVVWAVKVPGTGLKYRTTDEAYIAADEIEADGDRVADGLRHDGDDAKAERAYDQARELAEKIRAAAAAVDGEPAASDSPTSSEVEKPEPPAKPKQVRKRKRRAPGPGRDLIAAPFNGNGTKGFATECELAATRHEAAAQAYRAIAEGVRALEELGVA